MWQANGGVFHADISRREAEAARHSVEHLLYLQRLQRAALREAATASAQLGAVSVLAAELRSTSVVPPTSVSRALLWRAKHATDDACRVASETAVLLKALLATEPAPLQRGCLPFAAAAALSVAETLGVARDRLFQKCFAPQSALQQGASLLQPHMHPVLVTSAMLADAINALALCRVHLPSLSAIAADAAGLPGWQVLVSALAHLTALHDELEANAARWSVALPRPSVDAARPSNAFLADADKLLAEILLWAQAAQSSAVRHVDAADGKAADSFTHDEKIADWLRTLSKQLGTARMQSVNERFVELASVVAGLADASDPSASSAAAVLGALTPALQLFSAAAARVAGDYVMLHKSTAKLCGTLSGVFASLARNGFCAPRTEQDDGGTAAAGDKLLDDQAGTGVGEGEGKKDISEEIEDEAQVLGMEDLRQDGGAQPPSSDPTARGLEMQADFEGETHELDHDEDDGDVEPPEETDADQLDKQARDPRAGRVSCNSAVHAPNAWRARRA